MKSGSMSAYRAASDPEVWCGGRPGEDDPPRWLCPQCAGRGQLVIGCGLPPGVDDTKIETCDQCSGLGSVMWDPQNGSAPL